MIKRIYRIDGVNMEHILRDKFNHTELYIKRHLWKYDYLITKIINKMLYGKKYKKPKYKNYYDINSEDLIKKFGEVRISGKKEKTYLVIRRELKAIGMIRFNTDTYTDKNNQIKDIAIYKITDEFLSRGYSEVNYEVSDCIKLKLSNITEYKGLYATLRDNLSIISIDYDNALKYAKNALKTQMELKPKTNKITFQWDYNRQMNPEIYSHWIKYINDINDGNYNYFVDVSKTGRIFNHLSSLPSYLRKFIKINDKPIIELDVSNCQPLILNEDLDQTFEDVKLYKQLCEEGNFYSYMRKLIMDNDIETDDRTFKIDFFSKKFFANENRKHKWRIIFDKEFPNVAEKISEIKKENHVDLAIKLQRKESDIFIREISKRCINEGIREFFTIHDAIYTTEDNFDEVYNILKESFELNGLSPNIKHKTIN